MVIESFSKLQVIRIFPTSSVLKILEFKVLSMFNVFLFGWPNELGPTLIIEINGVTLVKNFSTLFLSLL